MVDMTSPPSFLHLSLDTPPLAEQGQGRADKRDDDDGDDGDDEGLGGSRCLSHQ